MQKLYAILLILSLTGLRGYAQQPEIIHLSELTAWMENESDTLYVLNFWATWCRPCVAEMPHFDRVQEEMQDKKVKVIFVSLDFVEDYESKLLAFLERREVHSEVVLLDEPKYNDWIDKVSEEWSGAIPATLFVRNAAGIRKFHEGDYDYATLKAEIESLIQ